MTGKVAHIVADKGFFFLRVGDIPPDYFAHKEDLPEGIRIEHLEIGQEFLFDPVETSKGPRAGNLRVVERTLDSLMKSNG